MSILKWVGVILCLGPIFSSGVSAARDVAPATVLWYLEQEPGIEPYRMRYLVTPLFMRSDDGRDDGDFLLYDRKKHRIYSVLRENRTVLEIDGDAAAPAKPDDLDFDVREQVDPKAPKIGDQSSVQLELAAGGQVCRSALVVPGFLERVRTAMQEYYQALAVRQHRTLKQTPEVYLTPCFLLRYVYASDFHFARGMLMAVWDDKGHRRELIGYEEDVSVSESLFVVPEDYVRFPGGE